MKKVLCIIESLGSGGAERQLCGLATMLHERGYDAKVAYYVNDCFYKGLLDKANVKSEFVPSLRNKWLRPIRMASMKKKGHFSCVISFLPSANIGACIAQLLYPTYIIISERNTNQDTKTRDRLTFNLYRLASHIITNSYSQEAYIKKHFSFLSKRVQTIINFVDTEYFKPSERHPNQTPRVITIARYTSQKNGLNYLKAIKRCKDLGVTAHFDWYGKKEYNPQYFQIMQQTITELDIADYITLHDQTADIISVYLSADVFCLPSIYEGFPNVVCEAMSCGLPIVCSRICDNPYIVEENSNGFLFDPHNPEEITECLKKVLSMTEKDAAQMKHKNREKITELCSPEKFADSFISLIEQRKSPSDNIK